MRLEIQNFYVILPSEDAIKYSNDSYNYRYTLVFAKKKMDYAKVFITARKNMVLLRKQHKTYE
jgi:hypothetical protein